MGCGCWEGSFGVQISRLSLGTNNLKVDEVLGEPTEDQTHQRLLGGGEMLALWRKQRKRETCLCSTSTSSTNETDDVEEDLKLGRESREELGQTRRHRRVGRVETHRKSFLKGTGGCSSGLAAGAVSTASCSAGSFSAEASESLTVSGEGFFENKPLRRFFFSSVELIVGWDGRTSG